MHRMLPFESAHDIPQIKVRTDSSLLKKFMKMITTHATKSRLSNIWSAKSLLGETVSLGCVRLSVIKVVVVSGRIKGRQAMKKDPCTLASGMLSFWASRELYGDLHMGSAT